MKPIASGKVFWSYDYELAQRNPATDYVKHFSGMKPFHYHEADITLTTDRIAIRGDLHLDIPVHSLDQLYLGFDDLFPRSLSKNFGLFWQPLRITLANRERLYLIIDYNFIGSKNKTWYNLIKGLLS
jgi:hypothetical protein